MSNIGNVSTIMHAYDRASLDRVAESMTDAWNAGDGTAFARSFASDADFVNIFALHVVGREGVAKQHQVIFDSFYRGSRIVFSIGDTRSLSDGIILAHLTSDLNVPDGPLAGNMKTLATLVLVAVDDGWQIASFHNTREQRPPGH